MGLLWFQIGFLLFQKVLCGVLAVFCFCFLKLRAFVWGRAGAGGEAPATLATAKAPAEEPARRCPNVCVIYGRGFDAETS